MPDGTQLELDSAFFDSIEADFVNKCLESITNTQNNAFKGLSGYINNHLYIQGGLSHFYDFENKIKEILNIDQKQVKMRTADERQYNSWLGGSVYASLDFPANFWISKNDYKEYGKNVLFRKIIN